MPSHTPSSSNARRNWIIAVVAGTITITAIVVAFAAEYLHAPWPWLRPAVELLLLAELVGLVVIERRQLFEPVDDKVSAMGKQLTDMGVTLGLVAERLSASGQLTLCASHPAVIDIAARVAREALAREQEAPQILRVA